MDSTMRKELIELSCFEESQRYAIFAKIEEGVSSQRRADEIKRLNQTYLEVVAEKKGLKESLHHMVETESYRWISKATYSLNPQPIRSQRTTELEPEAEASCIQDSVIFNKKEMAN